jgi:hypothetical protein
VKAATELADSSASGSEGERGSMTMLPH